MATPFPQTPRASRPIIEGPEDEAQSLDVVSIARRLREAQDALEPFAVGGAVLDNGGRVTHRGALRPCGPASRRRAPAR
jgi:hypothetical protein